MKFFVSLNFSKEYMPFACTMHFVLLFQVSSFSQNTSYWQEIIDAESKFVASEYDACVETYYLTFVDYGVNQLDNWFNAVSISEHFSLNKSYTDSLIFLILKEIDIFDIPDLQSKIAEIPKLAYVADTISHANYKCLKIQQRHLYSKWRALERRDQRPRKFPFYVFVWDKNLREIDSVNREIFFRLYIENGSTLPSGIELGKPNGFSCHWVIFQHANFNWREGDTISRLQQILMTALLKGKISPRSAQFHVVYTVLREIGPGATDIVYKDHQAFQDDWFNSPEFASMNDLLKEISPEELSFINFLRQQIYLEEITESYLQKRIIFKQHGLALR